MTKIVWPDLTFPPINLHNVWKLNVEPKDTVTTENFKHFSNKSCEFYPCHKTNNGEDINCMFCYCPLAWLKCPGSYTVIESPIGVKRKDCSQCTITHGKEGWNLVQHWLKNPIIWDNL